MPLRTELRSGDVVEIIGAPNARPNPAWLNFVCTGSARSKIRHYLKNMEQEESQALGEKMLAQALRAEGLKLPGDDAAAAPIWQQLTRWSGNKSREDLFIDIGLGRKIATIVARAPDPAPRRERHAPRRADADDGPLRRRRRGALAGHRR